MKHLRIKATQDIATPPNEWNEVKRSGMVINQAVAAGIPKIKS
jgi:hypothetical protein